MQNVGSKIKVMTIVLVILGLIGCLIMFVVGNGAYQDNKDYIEYATINGGASYYDSLEAAGNEAYNGLQLRNMSLTLAACIVVSALPLYGFGVIVENSERQTELMEQMAQKQKRMDASLTELRTRVTTLSAAVTAPTARAQSADTYVSQHLPEL